ncbi:methyltransferase domain-containing protein [Methylolobus aquaticus]|nr:methyltransferase domain-containing protein [Methylolobus aquaticus]
MGLSRRAPPAESFRVAADAVVARYRPVGRFAQGFVRGKLRHDPVYRYLFEAGLPPADGAVVDLGCGRGIVLAVLASASALALSGEAQATGPHRVGIERREAHAAAARAVMDGEAEIVTGDVLATDFPSARLILLIDVLLYLNAAQQDQLLERAAARLNPGGLLVIREADAAAGWRFATTVAAERISAWRRCEWRQRYHYRSRTEWVNRLGELGLAVRTIPMSEGTPFANLLYCGEMR